jgi:hypothetical protein
VFKVTSFPCQLPGGLEALLPSPMVEIAAHVDSFEATEPLGTTPAERSRMTLASATGVPTPLAYAPPPSPDGATVLRQSALIVAGTSVGVAAAAAIIFALRGRPDPLPRLLGQRRQPSLFRVIAGAALRGVFASVKKEALVMAAVALQRAVQQRSNENEAEPTLGDIDPGGVPLAPAPTSGTEPAARRG